MRKVRKLQRQLGNPDWRNTLYTDFPRPKGMWHDTHRRTVESIQHSLKVLLQDLERTLPRNAKRKGIEPRD
jgi:hypothetical protein